MKKIIKTTLCFLLFFTMLSSTAYAENNQGDIKATKMEETIKSYFTNLLDSMQEDSNTEYVSSDFDSIDGYIITKNLSLKKELYKDLYNGIDMVKINDVIINDISTVSDNIQAMVYIKYAYTYNDGQDSCLAGILYRVTLSENDNEYFIVDISSNEYEFQAVKDALTVSNARGYMTNFKAVDQYFAQQEKNIDEMLATPDSAFADVEDEKDEQFPIKTSSVSVSYNANTAGTYGEYLGDDYENYIFNRTSPDCTNFVSQCVWAGYGGTSGYTIPYTSSATNTTAVALKNRVKNDYRMVPTGPWYGRSYGSTLGVPPTNWGSVTNFYSYVTGNAGNGPRGTGYNNNSLYTNLSTTMRRGDILQFYNSGSQRYGHSVIVVTATNYSITDYKNVRVAQHSSEFNNRPLGDAVAANGGAACKMRLLRLTSTTFAN